MSIAVNYYRFITDIYQSQIKSAIRKLFLRLSIQFWPSLSIKKTLNHDIGNTEYLVFKKGQAC